MYLKFASKLKYLRVMNNVTLMELSSALGISINTLKVLESGNGRSKFYYYYLYCRHFGLYSYKYLNYDKYLETNTINDKVLWLKAYCGFKTTFDVEKYIGTYYGSIYDTTRRGDKQIERINSLLDEKINKIKKEIAP